MTTLRLGTGPKSCLCVHGLGSNSSVFLDSIPEVLFGEWTFYCIDLPGHGKKPQYDGPDYSIPNLLKWLQSTLPLPHFDAFMGHSLGGLLCMLMQLSTPQFSRGIILDLFPSARHPKGLKLLAQHFKKHFEAQLKHFYSFSHSQHPKVLQRILEDAQKTEPSVFYDVLDSLADMAENHNRPMIFSIPLTVIHQPGLNIDTNDKINRTFLLSPDVTFLQVSQSGHFVMLTQIQEFQEILTESLGSIGYLL
ncbi:MAG: alpha/beta fold hydrolase [Candidatus Cloacimonetes bacterium]|nr:alpha/beta fold hydrolase [Candidatus Cloacimonadota bacterium]